MKIFLLSILAIASCWIVPNFVKANELCETVSELAKVIMTKRQEGVSITNLIKRLGKRRRFRFFYISSSCGV